MKSLEYARSVSGFTFSVSENNKVWVDAPDGIMYEIEEPTVMIDDTGVLQKWGDMKHMIPHIEADKQIKCLQVSLVM